MKIPRIADALTQVDGDIVSGAAYAKKVKKNNWLKCGSIAACFAIIIMAAIVAVPMIFSGGDSTVTPDNGVGNEGVVNEGEVVEGELEKYYDYRINNGAYATYINGKVIDAKKVATKLESVTVTGGWKNKAGEWISTEVLNAEVYEITGIDSGIAVALKFINQGEAVTTTHYYVMMDPTADLSIVEEYIREPVVQNNPGDEMVNE